MLEVDNEDSDLDIIVTTFDCLFDRHQFFKQLEEALSSSERDVKSLIIIRDAKVPVAKFEIDGMKIDLVFAEMDSPIDLS